MVTGISVVICCYNSAKRLPQTLAHLASQKVADDLAWEVIVVDNASVDDTAQVAKVLWSQEAAVPLRVVHAPQQGLSYARHRGFTEAAYEIVSFVDDDNWLCPEWVQTVAEVMSQHPQVGACGGYSEIVSEVEIPWWFKQYQRDYAVGPQGKEAGDVTWSQGFLWGAGLSVRKQALQKLFDLGFQPLLSDRKGNTLASSGDYELCLALRGAGWRLWYEPRLQLRHCLPPQRLQWNYLRRLKRGFGASSVGLDAYSFISQENQLGLKAYFMYSWYCRFAIALLKLLCYPHKLLVFSWYLGEGDSQILSVETLIGRLSELLKSRKAYKQNIKAVREASWRVGV